MGSLGFTRRLYHTAVLVTAYHVHSPHIMGSLWYISLLAGYGGTVVTAEYRMYRSTTAWPPLLCTHLSSQSTVNINHHDGIATKCRQQYLDNPMSNGNKLKIIWKVFTQTKGIWCCCICSYWSYHVPTSKSVFLVVVVVIMRSHLFSMYLCQFADYNCDFYLIQKLISSEIDWCSGCTWLFEFVKWRCGEWNSLWCCYSHHDLTLNWCISLIFRPTTAILVSFKGYF